MCFIGVTSGTRATLIAFCVHTNFNPCCTLLVHLFSTSGSYPPNVMFLGPIWLQLCVATHSVNRAGRQLGHEKNVL